jgi:hypothetical protein
MTPASTSPTSPRGDFYLLTFNNGDNRAYIHWIAGAGRDKAVQRNLFNTRIWDVHGRIRRLPGEHRYGPWTITFYRFPPHPSGVHSAVTIWRSPASAGSPTSRPSTAGHTTTPTPRC